MAVVKKKKMPIWDERMFKLMEFVIGNKLKGIDNTSKFNKAVGIASGATQDQVLKLKQSFRHANLRSAANLFNVSMEWFYGFSDQMNRNIKTANVEELLMEALSQVRSVKLTPHTNIHTSTKKVIKSKK